MFCHICLQFVLCRFFGKFERLFFFLEKNIKKIQILISFSPETRTMV